MSIKLNRKGAGLAGEDRVKENQNLEMIEQEFAGLESVKTDSAAAKLSALEALAKADAADALSKNVQTQLNTIVVEGDSSPQAEQASVGARGEDYGGNLKARLDAEFNETATQLADKPNEADVRKNTNIQPINVAEMDTETKALFTGGSVAVVGVNSTGRENIKQKAVDESKIDFMKIISNNLLDETKMELGGYYTGSGVWAANASFKSSGLIPVTEGDTYTKNSTLTASYWGANYAYLSSFASSTFTVPVGAKYVRITYTSAEASPRLNIGATLLGYDKYQIGSDKFKATDVSYEEIDGYIDTSTENLFNKDTLNLTGSKLDASGNPTADATYGVSDYIPVDDWGIYITTNIHTVNYYDSNKVWVFSGTSTQPFTVPPDKNIAFARFNIPLSQVPTAMIVRGAVLPSAYVPYVKKDVDESKFRLKGYVKTKLHNKKWNAYGDSITRRGFGYHAIIKSKIGDMTVRNYGFSGRTLASRGTATDANFPPTVFDYVNMDNDADVISVFIGTNDFGSQIALGSIGSTAATEFYGALNIVSLGLIEKFPGKKICFITPMQRAVTGDEARAIPLLSYVNAMKEVGAKHGIPVFDLFANCGLYPKSNAINTAYFENGDRLHPNLKGHEVIAPRIQSFLESL